MAQVLTKNTHDTTLKSDDIVQEYISPALVFTENAARKVWELIEEEGNLNLKLRAFVTGGGCSGFQYGFSFEETVNADDTIIEKAISKKPANNEVIDEFNNSDLVTVQLLIDPMSFQYLAGAEIDYKCDLEGERFIIRNPNAKTTCGCGSSFSA